MEVCAAGVSRMPFENAEGSGTAFQIEATKDAGYEARVRSVKVAQQQFATFNQQRVDRIFAIAARAASLWSKALAEDAVAETGMGVVADKERKNRFASDLIYRRYRYERTAGVVSDDRVSGITKFVDPIGVIAGITPLTNPTSTTIFKALLALKTRNGIIFFPHPSAKNCTITAARVILHAAVYAGAPEGIIDWIDEPSVELTSSLIRHDDISLILATGGPGVVRAAYRSGKPAIGVGAGNTPAIIAASADVAQAVRSILARKLFDNGLICASEQSVIVERDIYEAVKAMFQAEGGYLLSPEETDRLRRFIGTDGRVNPRIIGQNATRIAEMAGIDLPAGINLLVAEADVIGPTEPLSREKLAPVLAMYRAGDFKDALGRACGIVANGGQGHTASLHVDPGEREKIRLFAERLQTARLLLNCPSSHGAIGGIYNRKLDPSLTLGCGTWGGSSICENLGVKHLLNTKILVERRESDETRPTLSFDPWLIRAMGRFNTDNSILGAYG